MRTSITRVLTPLLMLAPPTLAAQRTSPADASSDVAERIRRVETGLLRAVVAQGRAGQGMPIAERMRFYAVPGVSIAVISDGRIEWARGYGVTEAGGTTPVDTGTLFQAASISKPVAALAALRFVQDGRVGLDEDVNRQLVSWTVPEGGLTGEKKVTLRGILSHGAGLTVHGFRGYAAGESVPTLRQVLDGAPPANSAAIRVDLAPGTRWRYSGGGYTVMQRLLEDLAGKPFPVIMRETVLDRLGMRSSTYEQPLPAVWAGRAATAHGRDGTPIPGRWHTYPEMAAAGLWTTPSDLARLAVEVHQSLAGQSNRVLTTPMTREMLTRQTGDYGLGFGLDGEGTTARFGHGGSNAGFRCTLLMFSATGQGIVVMTNGDNGAELAQEIVRGVAREYGWPAVRPSERPVATPSAAALDRLAGRYRIGPGELVVTVTRDGDRLLARLPWAPRRELLPQSDTTFWVAQDGSSVTFRLGADGRGEELILPGAGGASAQPIRARREP